MELCYGGKVLKLAGNNTAVEVEVDVAAAYAGRREIVTPYNQTETTELSRRDTLKGLAVLVGLASAPTGLVGLASEAQAGQRDIYIDELYRKSTPVDHIMDGMRTHPFFGKENLIKSRFGKPIVFKRGEFTNYYFGDKYGDDMREIFEDGGTNIDQLTKFLSQHRNEYLSGLFIEGFFDLLKAFNKTIYILPIGKNVADKIYAL